jgi:hypothetical protein
MTEFSSDLPMSADTYEADLAAFHKVVSAMQPLDPVARRWLLATVATFFRIGNLVDPAEPNYSSSGGEIRRYDNASAIGGFSEDRSITPKEFLLQKKPVTDVEQIACLAYYLTHYRETPEFKTLDLSQLNTEAAQVKFSNAAKAVDNATRAGFLIPTKKGNKQISANAELYVRELPDKVAAKAAISHSRNKRKGKRPRQAAPANDEQGDE